jgi:hypothetical protein
MVEDMRARVFVEEKLNLNELSVKLKKQMVHPALSLSELTYYRHNESISTKLAITHPGAE